VNDEKRTWERQDPRADAYLIDPGPMPEVKPLRHQEKAYRQALHKSKPEPIKKGQKK